MWLSHKKLSKFWLTILLLLVLRLVDNFTFWQKYYNPEQGYMYLLGWSEVSIIFGNWDLHSSEVGLHIVCNYNGWITTNFMTVGKFPGKGLVTKVLKQVSISNNVLSHLQPACMGECYAERCRWGVVRNLRLWVLKCISLYTILEFKIMAPILFLRLFGAALWFESRT